MSSLAENAASIEVPNPKALLSAQHEHIFREAMINLSQGGKLEKGLLAKAAKNMKVIVKFLATSNTCFQQLDMNMPHSQSTLYKQLHYIVYHFMNPKAAQGQPPRASGRARGRVQTTNGKTNRLTPIKKSGKKNAEEHNDTVQSSTHKISKFVPDSPEKSKVTAPTSIYDS